MLTFKQFIEENKKRNALLDTSIDLAGAAIGGTLGNILSGGDAPSTAAGATFGAIATNRVRDLFKVRPKNFRVKIVNNKLKPHIPDPKPMGYINNNPLSHQANPKPIKK